jgi:hypothetical protein
MMLATCTWLPPTWLAMLPQKFSAATTRITFPPEVPAGPAVFAEVELQAASKTATAASSPVPSRSGGRDAILRDVSALGRDIAVLAPVGMKTITGGL